MTAFIIICAAMVAAALLWIILPLLRPKQADQAGSPSERRVSSIVVALALPLLAVIMYAGLSNWDWDAVQADHDKAASIEQMLSRLESKLAENPKDVEGWLLLGRSYTTMGRFARSADAYQQAYDLTRGENVEAIVGLGEALALTDQASLSGRAGQLFEAALAKAPNHPKALWYGSMAALQQDDLRLGRDRLQSLLAQNPPEQLRTVLERQIQDLNQQLGQLDERGGQASPHAAAGEGAAGSESPPAGGQRSIRVAVVIAPQIKEKLSTPLPLFVMARDSAAGGAGPPLAVKRLSSEQAPLTIELSERDAMIPSRTLASVPKVQVVARLSRSGTPQAQSGDFFGQADYEFAKDTGTLQITIDQTVP